MKKIIFFALALLQCAISNAAVRDRKNFDDQWRFAFGNAADPAKDFGCGTEYFNSFTKAGFFAPTGPYSNQFKEDSRWRTVDLPYDFVVDLPFAEPASYSHGHKTIGYQYPETSVGWYRKVFHLPESDRGRHIRIQFDGIFRDATIWVNGFVVGKEPSGYIHQDYDITPYLFFGEGEKNQNIVCVRADATYEEGWFYEGAGIYRHTWLVKSDPLHVATDGHFIHADVAEDFRSAKVFVETEVANDRNCDTKAYQLRHEIISPEGEVVATFGCNGKTMRSRQTDKTVATVTLQNPLLWSLENPFLYKVRTQVLHDGKVVDELTTRTGFRHIRMDKDQGLFLNGRHVKLMGFDNHQDHAGVGAAIPDGLQVYRIEQLKKWGANAYRTSHNPATTEMLEACDSLGMLVFEENRLLGINDFQMSVARNMIRHDRNHPCIFLWGTSNEEWGMEWEERCVEVERTMVNMMHLEDPTRLVGVASASGPQPLLGVEVAGYNYFMQHPIERYRQEYPERLALGSEETSGCGTRGIYFHDKPEKFVRLADKDDNEDKMNNRANQGTGRMPSRNRFPDIDHEGNTINRIERGWQFYDERPWLMGLFYWTGFDYRGEPVPLSWPATGSPFGVLDYCGFPKDEAYYCKAWWKPEEMTLHILPHWNLQGHEGEEIDVWVYSNCDEVELRVNGKNLGRQQMPKGGHLAWKAIYKPGRVEAIGYKNGKKIATERIETTGEATQVVVNKSRHGDITVCDITLKDKKGRFVPTACNQLTATISGPTRFLGWGNGDSAFRTTERPATPDARTMDIQAFNGHAQVILQGEDANISITLNN